jgi:chemotaxis protein histidine kinase CheA
VGIIPDIAVLGIDVDSRSVAKARDEMGKFVKSADDAGKAADGLGRSSKGAVPAVDALGAATGKVVKGTDELGKGVTGATNLFDRYGPKIQGAGFQLSDFVVQVQGGTGALRAFSQQFPQFASMFGPIGAVVGVVGGLASGLAASLIPALFSTGDGMTDAAGKTLTFSGQLDALTGSADAAAAKLGELNSAQLKVITSQSEAAAASAGENKTGMDRFFAALQAGAAGTEGGIVPPGPEVTPSGPIFAPGTPEAAFKQAQAASQSLYPPQSDQDTRDYQKQLALERKRARESLPTFDPLAGQRKAASLYPEGGGDAAAMDKELAARAKADHDKAEAAAKSAAGARASEAKSRAAHAQSIAKSLEDLTVAANDNATAMGRQEAAVKGGAANSIALEAAQKQARAVQDQAQIETQLRRFRGEASAEQIQQARTALQAQAEAKRSLEDQTKALQDQVNWEAQLSAAKRNRADADQAKLMDLQAQTAGMMLDQQRSKIQENRDAFVAYGQVGVDALGEIALSGEKANVAIANLLKTWANMAFQVTSQRLLQALATAMFPQATGAAPAGFGQTLAAAGVGAAANSFAPGAGAAAGRIGGGDIYAHQAGGGDSLPGKTYMVGEHGRERFTPWTKGRVEPESRKAASSNLHVSTTNNISLSGSATQADGDMVAKAVEKQMNQTIDARLARHARAGGAFAA